MTIKEALEILLASYYNNANYQEVIEAREKLEKDLERLESLEKQNELLKKDLKEYQAYIKKGVEEHYKDFMSNYDLLLQEYKELYKRLEILECFKKIDKKELKYFIETQIRYALNENTWLSACNCDLEKEKPTKHLIKIKEWLENEKDNI